MVLVKLVGEPSSLMGQKCVVWGLEDDKPLSVNLKEFLRSLGHPHANTFADDYNLQSSTGEIYNLQMTPSQLNIVPGQDINILRKNASLSGPSNKIEDAHQLPAGLVQNSQLRNQLTHVTAEQSTGVDISNQVHKKFKDDLLLLEQRRTKESHTLVQRKQAAEAREEYLMEELFRRLGIQDVLSRLRSLLGITTLRELCCKTSGEVASVGMDQRVAFELISEAHALLLEHNIPIDWNERLRDLYMRYNPSKADQVPALLTEYHGEEADMWMALRAKYEPAMYHDVVVMGGTNVNGVRSDRRLDGITGLIHGGATNMLLAAAGATTVEDPAQVSSVFTCPSCGNLFQLPCESSMGPMNHASTALGLHGSERAHLLAQLEQANARETELKDLIATLTKELRELQEENLRCENALKAQCEWTRTLEDALNNRELKTATLGSVSNTMNRIDIGDIRRKLCDFYLRYFPQHLGSVDSVMSSFAEKEREVNSAIELLHASKSPKEVREILEANIHKTQSKGRLVNLLGKGSDNASVARYGNSSRLRRLLVDFILKYAPDKLTLVDVILEEWKGREKDLEASLNEDIGTNTSYSNAIMLRLCSLHNEDYRADKNGSSNSTSTSSNCVRWAR